MEEFLGRFSGAAAVRRVLIGLFLVLAFGATSAVLLFVLTAEQLQGAIASPDIAFFKPTVGAIRQYVAQIERYYAIEQFVSSQQKDIGSRLLARGADEEAALSQMSSSADNIRVFVNSTSTLYIRPPLTLKPFTGSPPQSQQVAPPQAASQEQAPEAAPAEPSVPSTASNPRARKSRASGPPPESLGLQDALAAYFAMYYEQAATLPGAAAEAARRQIDAFKDQVYKRYGAYAAARAKYDSAESEVRSLKAQNDALDAQENDYYNEIIADPSPLAKDAFWNLCEDFLSFKSLVGDWAYNIVLFPKMMLVLILAIFMGILGSLIYISQDFLKDPTGRGFWDILFRLGLGAGVAFALFFFAAAGMLALSQNPNGTQTEMSPYLISFLGITGGYLSDRVTQWMREVGEKTFAVADGAAPPRWAVGLDAALKATGMDNAALASACGANMSDVEAWVAVTKPVPGDKQALIAAFLRQHASRIFTDIAPAWVSPAAAAATA
jgi:hypothetical protein